MATKPKTLRAAPAKATAAKSLKDVAKKTAPKSSTPSKKKATTQAAKVGLTKSPVGNSPRSKTRK